MSKWWLCCPGHFYRVFGRASRWVADFQLTFQSQALWLNFRNVSNLDFQSRDFTQSGSSASKKESQISDGVSVVKLKEGKRWVTSNTCNLETKSRYLAAKISPARPHTLGPKRDPLPWRTDHNKFKLSRPSEHSIEILQALSGMHRSADAKILGLLGEGCWANANHQFWKEQEDILKRKRKWRRKNQNERKGKWETKWCMFGIIE